MNLVSRNKSSVVIRQIPFFFLFGTAFLSLPFIAFSLVHIFNRTEAEGKYACLFIGLFLLWVFLEFLATRERIDIDLDEMKLKRSVSGVFRRKKQLIDLRDIKAIVLEIEPVGRRHQYLYMYGSKDHHLLNSPWKLNINHDKMGKLLSELTGLPYEIQDYGLNS
jgi:hypothetical protein